MFSRKKGVWMGSQKEAEVRKVRRKDSDSDMKLYMKGHAVTVVSLTGRCPAIAYRIS